MHPIVIIVPALMLLDYYLTLAGASLHKMGFGKHITTESYELNPLWQKDISVRTLLNIKHLIIVGITLIALLLLDQIDFFSTPYGQGIIGALILLYTVINARHLANLLIYYYAIRNPQYLSGQALLSQQLSLITSISALLTPLLMLCIINVLFPEPFITGGIIGVLLLMLQHIIWIRKHKKETK